MPINLQTQAQVRKWKGKNMAESFLQSNFAERIGGSTFGKDDTVYKFEKIKRAKRAATAANPGIALIDMGVGEPDEPAFPQVVEALCAEAGKPENRFYSDNGIDSFQEAAARYMQALYGVTVDPKTEVVHCIGAKSALSLLPACFINPGDICILTTPGYPVLGTWSKYLGGEVVNLGGSTALTTEIAAIYRSALESALF